MGYLERDPPFAKTAKDGAPRIHIHLNVGAVQPLNLAI